jgi:hypothetical protein
MSSSIRFGARLCVLSLLAAAVALSAGHANAAIIYWDGTGTGWDAAASWDDGLGVDPPSWPIAGDVATFSTAAVITDQIVNLNAAQAADGLDFLAATTTATTLLGGSGDQTRMALA